MGRFSVGVVMHIFSGEPGCTLLLKPYTCSYALSLDEMGVFCAHDLSMCEVPQDMYIQTNNLTKRQYCHCCVNGVLKILHIAAKQCFLWE